MINTSWFNVFSFLGVWTVIWLPIALVVSRTIGWLPSEPLTQKQKLILLASLYIIAPVIILWKLNIESLSFANLGIAPIRASLWYVLLGLGISTVSLVLVFCLESAADLVTWHWHNSRQLIKLLLPILCLGLLISLIEELIFRGYIFFTLSIDNSVWLAAIASSAIFAVLHLIWEREQTLPQIPGLCLMGLVLVLARVWSNNTIYLAIGLHAGWIWGLTCIDGANLLTYKDRDHWFTGIKQQPLAGMAGILCLAIAVGAMLIVANLHTYIAI